MSSPSLGTLSEGHNLRMDREAYAKCLWDYHFTNGCFPRGIRPTDVDFMVEMSNHFLFGEFEGVDKAQSKGQDLALRRLAARPGSTVFVVVGYPPDSVGEWYVIAGSELGSGLSGTGRESFLEFLRKWAVAVR